MKVKYLGVTNVALNHGQIFNVKSIEKGWYRINTNIPNDFTGEPEDYLFPAKLFEIIDETKTTE